MRVRVEVYKSMADFNKFKPYRDYVMDHESAAERRVLGEQCRNAFEGGQVIVTYAVKPKRGG